MGSGDLKTNWLSEPVLSQWNEMRRMKKSHHEEKFKMHYIVIS
jgi:hypothetical protein